MNCDQADWLVLVTDLNRRYATGVATKLLSALKFAVYQNGGEGGNRTRE
jgi:hypothetical protein